MFAEPTVGFCLNGLFSSEITPG